MKRITLLAVLASLTFACSAQDRLFTYTYQSGVLNKGQRELEIWNTARVGHNNYFRAYDARTEFEFGLGRRVQTAFYLNFKQESGFNTESKTIENQPLEFSFSNEWKWKLLDPSANPVGLALYSEIEYGSRELALELKLILDKRIGATTHAVNFVYEPEWESEADDAEVENELETTLELDYGFAWNIKPGWNIGLEARNHNKISGAENNWENSALFIGPGFSYSTNNLWINFSIMPQVANLHHVGAAKGLDTEEHERLETRVIFSYAF